MTIGDENTFEVGACESIRVTTFRLENGTWLIDAVISLLPPGIEAASIGNLNTFGVKCHVTQGLTLEDRCVIGERGLSLETPSPCSVAGDV